MAVKADPAVAKLLREVNKAFGEGTLVEGSKLRKDVLRATTGSLAFDLALGGGWPLNQWNEVLGHPSSGKTAVCLKTVAANQRLDPNYLTLWVAAEHLIPEWAEKLGVDMERVLVVDTNIMEDAYTIVIEAIADRVVDCVVVDSIPALVPKVEFDEEITKAEVATRARVVGRFFRKSGPGQKRSLTDPDRDCLLLMINQWRDDIGVMFGDPRTSPGGKNKNFSYFTRVDVSKVGDWIVDENSVRIGQTVKILTLKNKTYPQRKTAQVDFYFDDGNGMSAGDYDVVEEVFSLGRAAGVVGKEGNYYTFNDERIYNEHPASRAKAIAVLRGDLTLQDEIRDEVLRVFLPHIAKGSK